MRLRHLWFPIILLALARCGGGDDVKLEKGPFLFLDRESLGFGQEFGSGTYIGTAPLNALYIENRGDQPLMLKVVLDSATPAEFTLQLPPELTDGKALTLQSREHTTIQAQFQPTKEQVYTGKFTLYYNKDPNDQNLTQSKDIPLSGKGVKPPPSP
ncbi:MAG: hypothetical protein ACJ8AT_03340 [Hyalangium sp.]|uniref:hypothetical protein n=1 Tax=Hyalangium sp. TaxID=2028555 RepID=UPI00389AB6F9